MERLGIVGAGAWGTALAIVAARAGRQVRLWGRDAALIARLRRDRRNPRYLSEVALPETIEGVDDLTALADSDAILLVTPAQTLRRILADLPLTRPIPLVVCAKGLERETGELLSEVVAETAPAVPCAFLSGPAFAGEVAAGLPTAVTVGCTDAALGEALTAALGSTTFRPYANTDAIGVQVGGAVKNVMAIASGIVEGRRLGENARAALVARGLAEMTRLATALGGREATLMGLSGLGDLALSCFSRTSRNYDFGVRLGGGQNPTSLLAAAPVVEGAPTAAAVARRAEALGVDLPICRAVNQVVHDGADLDAAINGLLSRPFRTETTEEAP